MKKRKILITNDDGIQADGLFRLVKAAVHYGEVWVVAPDGQRSAASHSITLHSPFTLNPFDFPVEGVKAWACSGTPSDCVRAGSLFLMPDRPDVVLSGINHGYNVASDIQYSATAGAAFEASFQGYTGIALSENACDCHEAADAYLEEVLDRLIGRNPGPGCIWNVNFPGCPLSECRGILEGRTVSKGMVFRDAYKAVEVLPDGGVRVIVDGTYNEDAEEGTDFRSVVENYVSIGTVRNIRS